MGLCNSLKKQFTVSFLIFVIFNTQKVICDSEPVASPKSCPEAESPYSHISAPSSSFSYQDSGSSPDASPNAEPSMSPMSAPTPTSASPEAEPESSDAPSQSPSEEDDTLLADDGSDSGYDLNSLTQMVNDKNPDLQGLLSTAAESASDFLGTSKATMNSPEVKKICDSTDYPDLCVGSIAPFFNGNTDPAAVLEMAIKSAAEVTKLAAEKAKSLATSSGTSDDDAAAYEQCQEDFDDASSNLQSALDALPAKDVGTMNTMLSAAIADIASCGDAFGEGNPLKGYDEKIRSMTSNCLAIATSIK